MAQIVPAVLREVTSLGRVGGTEYSTGVKVATMKMQHLTGAVLYAFAAACFISVFVMRVNSGTASNWDLLLSGIPALILPCLSVHQVLKARREALTSEEGA